MIKGAVAIAGILLVPIARVMVSPALFATKCFPIDVEKRESMVIQMA